MSNIYLSSKFLDEQRNILTKHLSEADVAICTAQVLGKKAPVLISQEMVESMASGSVVVDLAVEAGGNCPLSKEGEVVNANKEVQGTEKLPELEEVAITAEDKAKAELERKAEEAALMLRNVGKQMLHLG